MPLQVLRKTGVELQSNAEGEVAGDEHLGKSGERDMIEMKPGADKQDEENEENDDELKGKERESVGTSASFGPVANAVADDLTFRANRIEERVRNTGLRTVRAVVNGGLALFALGAMSPVGLLLRHLDDMKTEEGRDGSGTRSSDSEGEESPEGDNDL